MDVIDEDLTIAAEREAKLSALRLTIEESIARGGANSESDLDLALTRAAADRHA